MFDFTNGVPDDFPGANEEQASALRSILKLVVDPVAEAVRAYLCGCGGSGKTHTVGMLARALADMEGAVPDLERLPVLNSVAFVAPTHVAASVAQRRLAAAGIGNRVTTIHGAVYKPIWREPDTTAIADWARAVRLGNAHRDDVPQQLRTMVRDVRLLAVGLDAGLEELALADEVGTTVRDADLVGTVLRNAGEDPLTTLLDTRKGDAGWQPRVDELADVLVVDEASMVTEATARRLQGLCRVLVLVGDAMQLPPVVANLAQDDLEVVNPCISATGLGKAAVRVLLKRNMRSVSDTGRLIADVGNVLRDRARQMTMHEFERLCIERPQAFSFVRAWDPGPISEGQLALTWRNGTRVGLAALYRQACGRRDLAPGDLVTLSWFPPAMPDAVGDNDRRILRNSRWRVLELGSDQRRVLVEDVRDPATRFWLPLRVSTDQQHIEEAARIVPHAPTPTTFNDRERRCFWANWGAFATTHKAQGDECDVVQISLDDLRALYASVAGQQRDGFGYPFVWRWAYTAISRARQRVVFVSGTEMLVSREIAECTMAS